MNACVRPKNFRGVKGTPKEKAECIVDATCSGLEKGGKLIEDSIHMIKEAYNANITQVRLG